jgi:PKD repeat protein
MRLRLFFLKTLTSSLLLLTVAACDIENGIDVKTAEFTVNDDSVYLTKPLKFIANDTLGGNEYYWDFGDGNKVVGKHNITHTYESGGTYMATLTINGFTSSKLVTIFNGTVGFKFINKSNKYIDILTYIDDYQNGNVNRFLVPHRSESKTIYCTNSYTTGNHILGISLFINNSEYNLENVMWIADFQHYDIILTDSTRVYPRSSNGNSSIVMIKDL